MEKDFAILNWNVGGAKFLEACGEIKDKDERNKEREKMINKLNNELMTVIIFFKRPQIITLQEIVQWKERNDSDIHDLINYDKFINEGYIYHPFPLIDSRTLSSKEKWEKVQQKGGWPDNTYFAQGNAFLFREDLPHFPIWDITADSKRPAESQTPKIQYCCDACGDEYELMHQWTCPKCGKIHEIKTDKEKREHYIEKVDLESGLYFGDRDTEPRAALVAHFIINPENDPKPLDIFVINTHLTTITMEREGIPEIDSKATEIRLSQLEVIFKGIVSRYNSWKQKGYPARDKVRKFGNHETAKRHPPVWIVAGDFNFTQTSTEYERIQRWNFMDVVPNKGSGTKAKGAGKPASLTLDYIFAGPKFISLDPLIIEQSISDNHVSHQVEFSDHYPMFARIPLEIEDNFDMFKLSREDIRDKFDKDKFEDFIENLKDEKNPFSKFIRGRLSDEAKILMDDPTICEEPETYKKFFNEFNKLIFGASLYDEELFKNQLTGNIKERIEKWWSLPRAKKVQVNRILLELAYSDLIKTNPLNIIEKKGPKSNEEEGDASEKAEGPMEGTEW
jgi:endonuclease/exonuclease/phosphatase family metal-dependent hydrolase